MAEGAFCASHENATDEVVRLDEKGMRVGMVAFRARRTRTIKGRSFDARSRTRTSSALHERSGVMPGSARVLLLAALQLIAPMPLVAESPPVIEVAKFSSGTVGRSIPDGWTPLTFKKVPKHTRYELVRDGEYVVVKAMSDASASGLTKEIKIDPKEYPIIHWRWRVENILRRSDVSQKSGDDYPARIYITFEYDSEKTTFSKRFRYKAGRALFGDIPIAALNYIWETKTAVGTIVGNAYTDFAQMIVVESGAGRIGMWVDEERNIYEDYRNAFGEDPPMINGVAIMTDTDDTGEQATAYYGDIVFRKSAMAGSR